MDLRSEVLNASQTLSDAELATIKLFNEYPDGLLKFATVCCLIIMLIGIPGNIITIIALSRYKKVRNATAIFIINLTCSDLLYCFNMPFVTSAFHHHVWTHGLFLCHMSLFISSTLSVSSRLSICAITINRYIMIAHPKLYTKIYETRNIIIMLVCLWIFSIGSNILIFIIKYARFDLNKGSCFNSILRDHNNRSPKKLLNLAVFILLCIEIICYSRIFCVVQKSKSKLSNKKKRLCKPKKSSSTDLTTSVSERVTDELSGNNFLKPEITTRLVSSRNTNTTNRSTGRDISDKIIRQPEKLEKQPPRLHRSTLHKSIKFLKTALPTQKDTRLGTMIIVIVISSCLCNLPITIITVFLKKSLHPKLNIAAHILYFSSYCINPIIYVVMSNEYKKAYKHLFKRISKANKHSKVIQQV